MLMKRRLITAAIAIAVLLAGVGGVAARQGWFYPPGKVSLRGQNPKTDGWQIQGPYRGNIKIRSADGKWETGRMPVLGHDPEASVKIEFTRDGTLLSEAMVQGAANHTMEDVNGNRIATITLTPFDEEQENMQRAHLERIVVGIKDYIDRTERPDPSGNAWTCEPVLPLPGMVGGIGFPEQYRLHTPAGREYLWPLGYPVAWKVYGMARVRARFFAYGKNARLEPLNPQVEMEVAGRERSNEVVVMPRKVLEQYGESKPFLTDAELSALDERDREHFRRNSAPPRDVPEVYWSFGKDTPNPFEYVNKDTGDWKNTVASGKFTGYGKHVVRDERTGRPVLILDVSALEPPKRTP